ncbi:MAG: Methylated-DNA--protein-cysteine methyltransferase [Caulobacter sp.]|nr:Methylated-DNA--protein-cysteine methyltransferase [Caulobacter sp.]
MLHFKSEQVPTPVGDMILLTDDQDRLRALDWIDYEPRMRRLLRLHYGRDAVALFAGRAASGPRQAVEAYLAGDLRAIDDLAVETGGTPFQRQVWAALRTIPPGRTVSYGGLARQIDRPAAVRAVGLANGANPVGVVVPCHRVIGTDGSLTGYGGGIARKRWLLRHEGVDRP